MKRETGVSPVRTRRCKRGALFHAGRLQSLRDSKILWEDETRRGYLSQKTCLEWVPESHEDLAGTGRHSFHKRVLSLRAKPLPYAEVFLLCFRVPDSLCVKGAAQQRKAHFAV